MKTDTKRKIIEIIRKRGRVTPKELVEELKIYQTGIHRHLNDLINMGEIERVGKVPKVFYILQESVNQIFINDVSFQEKYFLDNNYLWVSSYGSFYEGVEGFYRWCKSINQINNVKILVKEYLKIKREWNKFFGENELIDATDKFKQSFKDKYIDKVFYGDFYSLPKFGKTKLGQLVLYGKQAQDKKIINKIIEIIEKKLIKLIEEIEIEAIAFIPHSLPRKVAFLKYMEKRMKINKPHIKLVKAYKGEIRVAQKSLSKISERIENAKKTIYVDEKEIEYKKILLIDDAVGSGATFNEVAKKMKINYGVEKVYGFAIVGSLKGFEVIKEV